MTPGDPVVLVPAAQAAAAQVAAARPKWRRQRQRRRRQRRRRYGRRRHGRPGQPPEPGGPFGGANPFGDPQQFADALRQFADLMSYRGGPVNWDLAKNVARHAVAAAGDPSVLASQRNDVVEAVRLADLWLEDVTTYPSGIRTIEAWSRSEWVEATFPVWSKLCEPIAATVVEGMSSMMQVDPSQMEGVPEELKSAFGAFGGGLGGLGGLGAMMKQVGGAMIGGQTGAAVAELASEVVGSFDIGLPLGPKGTAALLPSGVAAFGEGLGLDAGEVRLFLALREAAHHRLFAHVPWLTAHLFGAVEAYARGMTVDLSRLEEAMPQIDISNPEALRDALAGGELFRPENTEAQKAALARLGDSAGPGRGLGVHGRGRRGGRPAAARERAGRGDPAPPRERRSRRADVRDAGGPGTAAAAAARGRGHLGRADRSPRGGRPGGDMGTPRPDAHGRGPGRPGQLRPGRAGAGHPGSRGGGPRPRTGPRVQEGPGTQRGPEGSGGPGGSQGTGGLPGDRRAPREPGGSQG